MDDNTRLERAIALALYAHEGQTDKCGMPYILHPLAVMEACDTINAKIVAAIHDVPEDTICSIEYCIRDCELTEYETAALRLLTKHKGQTYPDYLRNIGNSGNFIATDVKLNDIKHNRARLFQIKNVEERERLSYKYEKAASILLDIQVI